MDHILVGVDLSDASRVALDLALQLARAMPASLRIVHVIPPLGSAMGWAEQRSMDPAFIAPLEQQLADFVQERLDQHGKQPTRVDTQILHGLEFQELLSEAADYGSSLIVLGSHGRSRLERLLLGSVSSMVLRRSAVPVLIAREPGRLPTKILAAVDLGASTELLLRTAQQWQQLLGAELEIVHVVEPYPPRVVPNLSMGQEILPLYEHQRDEICHSIELAVQKVFTHGAPPTVRTLEGQPYLELCKCAQDEGFDLIVAGAHESEALMDLGDTVMRIAHRSACSVLVARPAPDDRTEGC